MVQDTIQKQKCCTTPSGVLPVCVRERSTVFMLSIFLQEVMLVVFF